MFSWLTSKYRAWMNYLFKTTEVKQLQALANFYATRNLALQSAIEALCEKHKQERGNLAAMLGALVLMQNQQLEIPRDIMLACTDLELDIRYDREAGLLYVNVAVPEEAANAQEE